MKQEIQERREELRENRIAAKEKLEQRNAQIKSDIQTAKKSNDTEDPFDVHVHDPIAMRLAHFFIKIGWSANAVTILSMVFGVGGGILFYPKNIWLNLIGIICEIMAAILDCSDGQIARLTHTSSQLGRVLDGLTDGVNFAAVYLGLGFRMMTETIPFTNTLWGGWIWLPVFFTGLISHMSQCMFADYYRVLHLFFLDCRNASDFSRAKDVEEEYNSLPADCPLYERIYMRGYLTYTRMQEKRAPKAQKLLDAIAAEGGIVPEEVSEAYTNESRKYIQITNVLTFNVRAYSLYILVLLGLQAFYFPFIVFILGALKYFMVWKYEKIAEGVYDYYYAESEGPDVIPEPVGACR